MPCELCRNRIGAPLPRSRTSRSTPAIEIVVGLVAVATSFIGGTTRHWMYRIKHNRQARAGPSWERLRAQSLIDTSINRFTERARSRERTARRALALRSQLNLRLWRSEFVMSRRACRGLPISGKGRWMTGIRPGMTEGGSTPAGNASSARPPKQAGARAALRRSAAAPPSRTTRPRFCRCAGSRRPIRRESADASD